MAELKTKATAASVEDFIRNVGDEKKQSDSFQIIKMMAQATGEEPKMWGTSLIGFGHVRLKSPNTGRETDWFRIGFSPRKGNFSLYVGVEKHVEALKKLGKHKTGKGCLYIQSLEDVDVTVLDQIIRNSIK